MGHSFSLNPQRENPSAHVSRSFSCSRHKPSVPALSLRGRPQSWGRRQADRKLAGGHVPQAVGKDGPCWSRLRGKQPDTTTHASHTPSLTCHVYAATRHSFDRVSPGSIMPPCSPPSAECGQTPRMSLLRLLQQSITDRVVEGREVHCLPLLRAASSRSRCPQGGSF